MIKEDYKNFDKPANGEDSLAELEGVTYTRGIGAYKPHFQGIPDSYYPLTCGEVCKGLLILLMTILTSLGIMIGFIFWATQNLEIYVIVWIAILLAFIVIAVILLFFGGKERRRLEKKLIEQSNRKQRQMVKNKK